MPTCDAEICETCPLADLPDPTRCLRRHAQACARLAATQHGAGKEFLETLSLRLMDEAGMRAAEWTVLVELPQRQVA